jgi:hypothetical protein
VGAPRSRFPVTDEDSKKKGRAICNAVGGEAREERVFHPCFTKNMPNTSKSVSQRSF